MLSFTEFLMAEPLPLAQIQQTILECLQGRRDVALFGAYAVNAYITEARMTQDVDILALEANRFATELQNYLHEKLHIAVRIREIKSGQAWRIYQVHKPENRHLADIRSVNQLPETELIGDIQVLTPRELAMSKLVAYHSRKNQPKAGTDWRDLTLLLLRFPELKLEISECLKQQNYSQDIQQTWAEISNIELTQVDDGY
ncbi:nucleotidyl transferase AbiEii/AbiGii toxin family protein [Synechococcus sp. C9]|uniref:nucleotidyl transferase AbiEii/AbiGii toxin family protein n=2 Tax=Synechococcus sp. C9 TaxID=102119 RepID=UPI001FF1BB26|nr:nucleotidyl transferase AbiEii/AbiGii toxin family protein [Synechococcus sp. C9]